MVSNLKDQWFLKLSTFQNTQTLAVPTLSEFSFSKFQILKQVNLLLCSPDNLAKTSVNVFFPSHSSYLKSTYPPFYQLLTISNLDGWLKTQNSLFQTNCPSTHQQSIRHHKPSNFSKTFSKPPSLGNPDLKNKMAFSF